MKIAVTNAVLSNTGDAAIFAAILESLETAGLTTDDIVVFDSNAAVTSLLYPQWNIFQQLTVAPPREPARLRTKLQWIRLRLVEQLIARNRALLACLSAPLIRRTKFAASYRELALSDLVISSGGTYLVDNYNFSPRITEFELVKTVGAKLVLWTQSMGPFDTPRSVASISKANQFADSVYFRDQRSAASWARVNGGGTAGDATTGGVAPDAVFALSAGRSADLGRETIGAPLAIVSVRKWARGADGQITSMAPYEAMMRSGVKQLDTEGWQVKALSTCQGVPTYPHDDANEAEKIFAGLNISIDHDFHTPTQLLERVAESQLVITTRMHLGILSLLSGRPVIAIAYEFKTLELFDSLGLSEFVVAIEHATPEWLDSAISKIKDDPARAILTTKHLNSLKTAARLPAFATAALIQAQAKP